MNDIPLQLLVLAMGAAMVFALHQQARAQRLRDELARVFSHAADARTRLLPAAALSLRLDPELQWARLEGVPASVAVFDVRGGKSARAAAGLRREMRTHESAFELSPGRFLVSLWDTGDAAADFATRRLGASLLQAGARVVEAGTATAAPTDEPVAAQALVARAERRMRPIDATIEQRLGLNLRAIVASLLALVAAYVVTPLLAEPREAGQWFAVLAGVAVGAGIGAVAAHGARDLLLALVPPRTLPGWGIASTACVGAVLYGALGARGLGGGVASLVAAQLAFDALLVLTIASAAPLVRARVGATIALALLAVGLVAIARDALPFAANLLRIAAAWGVGAALARGVDRLVWLGVVAVLVAGIDAWSVFAEAGLTHQLARADEGPQAALFGAVLLRAPDVDGAPLFLLGMTDLVFMALFLASAWHWRLPLARTGGALVASLVAALATSAAIDDGVPVLPFMSAAFLLTHWRVLAEEIRNLR